MRLKEEAKVISVWGQRPKGEKKEGRKFCKLFIGCQLHLCTVWANSVRLSTFLWHFSLLLRSARGREDGPKLAASSRQQCAPLAWSTALGHWRPRHAIGTI